MRAGAREIVFVAAASAPGLVAGCGAAEDQKPKVASAMQLALQSDLEALHGAAATLQAAAPTPSGRGWDATQDAAAIASMKAAWVLAREAYEHVEGAIAPIFPDTDVAIDERYDGFLSRLGPAGDADLFDGQGVTGMHAIERVLYSDVAPAQIFKSEATLPGYRPATFPLSEAEAVELKTGLCAQLVSDTDQLLKEWTAAVDLDVSGAFQGLIGLMNEQQEKVNNAASGAEESRYSQHTMDDLRANLAGTAAIYGLFRGWLRAQPAAHGVPDGTTVDGAIMAAFDALGVTYAGVTGDAIPSPPTTWSAENPSAADLQTPFGMLYQAIHRQVDPTQPGSIVQNMNNAAVLLRVPGFAG